MDERNADDHWQDASAKMDVDKAKLHRRRVLLAVALAAVFMLSSMQAVAMNVKAQTETRTFIYGLSTAVSSANPWVGIEDADYLYYSYVYDYLMFPDKDGLPTPNLATSWWHMNGSVAESRGSTFTVDRNASVWPTGSIWEFNLTQGVNWSDGEPFTADDVKFTFDLQTGANYPTFWAYQPYTRWIDHTEKVSDYQVRIFLADRTTKIPIPAAWLTSLSTPIMPKHILQDMSPNAVAANWTGIPAIGTGPFMGTDQMQYEMIAKESLTLMKNPQWESGLGRVYHRNMQIDRLILKFYSEESAMTLDLKTKKIDLCQLQANTYFSMLSASDRSANLTLVTGYSPTVYSDISHWNVNPSGTSTSSLNPARLDPAVWRASALATNRSAILQNVFKGLGVEGTGLISPAFPRWYWDFKHDTNMTTFNVTDKNGAIVYSYNSTVAHAMDFNLTRANAILDAAGYVWSGGTPGQGLRKIGPVAADRLQAMKAIGSAASLLGQPLSFLTLNFEDIYEQGDFEEKEIADYLHQQWTNIGIGITGRAVDASTWNQIVYGFQEHFTETYWSGDPDPNYLLYIPTSYSMDGWNEFGVSNDTYDHYYNMQAQSFNYTERKYWVDQAEKWMYLSGFMITTVFPKKAYGYNDWRWTNYGNWTQHSGLMADHFWGETPLFMQLVWTGKGTVGTTDYTLLVVAIAAIAAVAAVIVVLRKQKTKKMLEEEEEPAEEEKEG